MKIPLKHILVQHRYQAEDIQRLLKNGESFERLAERFSICTSAPQGGDLGVVALDRLDPEFAESAGQLAENQISAIVRTRFGYHIIFRYLAK